MNIRKAGRGRLSDGSGGVALLLSSSLANPLGGFTVPPPGVTVPPPGVTVPPPGVTVPVVGQLDFTLSTEDAAKFMAIIANQPLGNQRVALAQQEAFWSQPPPSQQGAAYVIQAPGAQIPVPPVGLHSLAAQVAGPQVVPGTAGGGAIHSYPVIMAQQGGAGPVGVVPVGQAPLVPAPAVAVRPLGVGGPQLMYHYPAQPPMMQPYPAGGRPLAPYGRGHGVPFCTGPTPHGRLVPGFLGHEVPGRMVRSPIDGVANKARPVTERGFKKGHLGGAAYRFEEVGGFFEPLTISLIFEPLMTGVFALKSQLEEGLNREMTAAEWLQFWTSTSARESDRVMKCVSRLYTAAACGHLDECSTYLLYLAEMGFVTGAETKLATPVTEGTLTWPRLCGIMLMRFLQLTQQVATPERQRGKAATVAQQMAYNLAKVEAKNRS